MWRLSDFDLLLFLGLLSLSVAQIEKRKAPLIISPPAGNSHVMARRWSLGLSSVICCALVVCRISRELCFTFDVWLVKCFFYRCLTLTPIINPVICMYLSHFSMRSTTVIFPFLSSPLRTGKNDGCNLIVSKNPTSAIQFARCYL